MARRRRNDNDGVTITWTYKGTSVTCTGAEFDRYSRLTPEEIQVLMLAKKNKEVKDEQDEGGQGAEGV